MEKETLEQLIKINKSQREIAQELNCSQTNIKYWLKKYNLSTIHNQYNKQYSNNKFCPKCETIKTLSEFYKRTNRDDYNGYCKICSNEYCIERVKLVKIKMMEYKGNQCEDCHLTIEKSHPCVFDFHHLDPTEKDHNWKHIKYQKWDKIRIELDKCVMLCSNCHRIRHANE